MTDTNCSNDCSSCAQECASRKTEITHAPLHTSSRVKKVYAVMSGKGGVGKSLVTGLLATLSQRMGYQAAILDADVIGPSIPRMFGVNDKAMGTQDGILPAASKTGVKMMSMNLLLENDSDPVVWRGPVIAGAIKQFWSEVLWGDVDIMFIDMPPGTSDVALTVFQSLPVNGVVLVTTPQELVGMIVEKAVKMAGIMNIPVTALVENMSYAVCPDCGNQYSVFGKSDPDAMAREYHIPLVARIPIDNKLTAACDKGMIEVFDGNWLDEIIRSLLKENTK